jgi:hypothetical protein
MVVALHGPLLLLGRTRLIKVYPAPTQKPVLKELLARFIRSLVPWNEICNTPQAVLDLKQSVLSIHSEASAEATFFQEVHQVTGPLEWNLQYTSISLVPEITYDFSKLPGCVDP